MTWHLQPELKSLQKTPFQYVASLAGFISYVKTIEVNRDTAPGVLGGQVANRWYPFVHQKHTLEGSLVLNMGMAFNFEYVKIQREAWIFEKHVKDYHDWNGNDGDDPVMAMPTIPSLWSRLW